MKKPLISVIIATYNEEKYIGNLIEDLIKQDIKEEFEVLVIDGMSTDKTKEIVTKKSKKNKKIKLLNNPKRRAPFAFNIGIKNSKGKYFMIIGAHSSVPKNFLKLNLETIEMKPEKVVAVGGKIVPAKSENKFQEAVDYVTSTFLGGGASTHRYSHKAQYVDTVVFGMYKKELIGKTRFDEKFTVGQDLEFNIQLQKKRLKLWFEPKIKSIYYSRTNTKKLKRQMWNYGVARMKIMQKHKNMKLANLIPPLFGAYLVLLIPLIFIHIIFLIPLILFILALIIGSILKVKTFFKNWFIYWIIWSRFSFGSLKQFLNHKKNNYKVN